MTHGPATGLSEEAKALCVDLFYFGAKSRQRLSLVLMPPRAVQALGELVRRGMVTDAGEGLYIGSTLTFAVAQLSVRFPPRHDYGGSLAGAIQPMELKSPAHQVVAGLNFARCASTGV